MTRSPLQRWRERGGRTVSVRLPFADIMEVALALLALSPDELAALGWSFAARKRVLEYFLKAGKQADAIDRAELEQTVLTLRLPLRDVHRLRKFAQRALPKVATRAKVIGRLEDALDTALGDQR